MLVRQILYSVPCVFSGEVACCEVAAELLLEWRFIGAILVAFLTSKFHQVIIRTRVPDSYLYLIIMLIRVVMGVMIVLVLMVSTLVAGRLRSLAQS